MALVFIFLKTLFRERKKGNPRKKKKNYYIPTMVNLCKASSISSALARSESLSVVTLVCLFVCYFFCCLLLFVPSLLILCFDIHWLVAYSLWSCYSECECPIQILNCILSLCVCESVFLWSRPRTAGICVQHCDAQKFKWWANKIGLATLCIMLFVSVRSVARLHGHLLSSLLDRFFSQFPFLSIARSLLQSFLFFHFFIPLKAAISFHCLIPFQIDMDNIS